MATDKSPMTIGKMEKDYGVDFGVRPNMRLATWLEREGLLSFGRAMRALEKKIKPQRVK